MDHLRVTETRGYGARLLDSIKGVVVGIVLFLGSFALLFWNEGRAVKTAKSLEEGASVVVSVPVDRVDPANEGKLVHVLGTAVTQETLLDDELGVGLVALRLTRNVEMYQWEEKKETETRKNVGGSETKTTTYTYTKKWSPTLIKSSSFKEESGHKNPAALPVEERDLVAKAAKLGAFNLPPEVIKQLSDFEKVALAAGDEGKVSGALRPRAVVDSGMLYVGTSAKADPQNPGVGDVRVSFQAIKPVAITVVAKQVSGAFEPYHAEAGDDVMLVASGSKDARAMFKAAEDANSTLTWVLRGVGWFANLLGLFLVLRPVATLADFIPAVGSLVGLGAFLFSAVVSTALSLVTIAIAWVVFRPVIGVLVFIGAAGALALAIVLMVRAKKSRRARRV